MGRRPAGSVDVVVVVGADGPEPLIRECVRRVLASEQLGVRVVLTAGGSSAVAAEFADPRVSAAGNAAGHQPPSPYRLELPCAAGLGPRSLARLVAHARSRSAGLVNVLLPGAVDGSEPVRLWSGPAADGSPGQAAGLRWEAATSFGIADLRHPPAPAPVWVRTGQWARDRLPAAVYARLAPRVKEARRRVRNYLFLD